MSDWDSGNGRSWSGCTISRGIGHVGDCIAWIHLLSSGLGESLLCCSLKPLLLLSHPLGLRKHHHETNSHAHNAAEEATPGQADDSIPVGPLRSLVRVGYTIIKGTAPRVDPLQRDAVEKPHVPFNAICDSESS